MPKPNNDRRDWENALVTAAALREITGLQCIGDGVYSAYPGNTIRGWDDVARAVGGYVTGGMLSQNANGLTWRVGRRWAGSLVHAEDVEAVLEARKLTAELTDWELVAERWSVGQCARILLEYIGEQEYCPKKPYALPADILLYPLPPNAQERPALAHDECKPGVYGYGELHDVKDAYPVMLRLIGEGKRFSLRPRIHGEGTKLGIDWGVWRPGERERLNEVLHHTWEHRTLCRALWGSALGSYDWRRNYAPTGDGNSKAVWVKGGAGHYRSLALLVARTMKDLCHEQCRVTEAVYGTVDSFLTTKPDTVPEVWNRYGIPSRVKYRGAWDIRGRGCWGIWERYNGNGELWVHQPPQDLSPLWIERTDPYRIGARNLLPVQREKISLRSFRLWL